MIYIGNIKYDSQIYNANQIVICGAGAMLDSLINELTRMQIVTQIVCLCDNKAEEMHGKYKDYCVLTYEKAKKMYPNADYIVYNRFAKEICETLYDEGISSIHLVQLNAESEKLKI